MMGDLSTCKSKRTLIQLLTINKEKSTRSTTTCFCKVLWSNHSEREATWEKETVMREKYPHLLEPKVTS
jgi:hypothetical protein